MLSARDRIIYESYESTCLDSPYNIFESDSPGEEQVCVFLRIVSELVCHIPYIIYYFG